MSKTAKIADAPQTAEYTAFEASKAADQFRVFAEKGMEQSKEAYAKVKAGAEDAQKALESTFETARTAGNEFSLKAIAALRANTEASFNHIEALFAARTVSDVVELQTAFFRKRVEAAVEQAKELQALTVKAAEDVAKPMRDVFEKNVRELKVA